MRASSSTQRRRGWSGTRVTVELSIAASRYALGVSGVVRRELASWRNRALAIEDPRLRRLALAKLDDEGFNAKAAAMLATFAPRRRRASVVRTIVALEVLFDYLDGRTEPAVPGCDPLAWRRDLFVALAAALARPQDDPQHALQDGDSEYLLALAQAVREGLDRLSHDHAIRETIVRAGARAAEAQVRTHALGELGAQQLYTWIEREREGSKLDRHAYHAGACASVLCIHALIAAAAHPPSRMPDVVTLDELYLRIAAVAALLDRVVDHELDRRADDDAAALILGQAELKSTLLGLVAQTAAAVSSRERSRGEPTMLAGVLAYYLTTPGASTPFATPIATALRARHGATIAPAYVLMRAWRTLASRQDRGGR